MDEGFSLVSCMILMCVLCLYWRRFSSWHLFFISIKFYYKIFSVFGRAESVWVGWVVVCLWCKWRVSIVYIDSSWGVWGDMVGWVSKVEEWHSGRHLQVQLLLYCLWEVRVMQCRCIHRWQEFHLTENYLLVLRCWYSSHMYMCGPGLVSTLPARSRRRMWWPGCHHTPWREKWNEREVISWPKDWGQIIKRAKRVSGGWVMTWEGWQQLKGWKGS